MRFVGKIYRKPSIFPVNMAFSCRFPLNQSIDFHSGTHDGYMVEQYVSIWPHEWETYGIQEIHHKTFNQKWVYRPRIPPGSDYPLLRKITMEIISWASVAVVKTGYHQLIGIGTWIDYEFITGIVYRCLPGPRENHRRTQPLGRGKPWM